MAEQGGSLERMAEELNRNAAEEEKWLVQRMRAGDESAFAAFADGYLPGLYRFARRRLGEDRELTRDIVQSTVTKVLASLDGYRGEAPLFTWLCACCGNEIAGHYRRRGRRPREVPMADEATEEPGTAAVAETPDPQASLLAAESAELVHATLDRLPAGYGQALEWRYIDGLTVPEIAARLRSTYKATESLLSRARGAFRERYRQLTDHEPRRAAAGGGSAGEVTER